MDLAPGDILADRYEVLRPLGSGGSASTWLVSDRLWRTRLALKAIRSMAFSQALRSEFATLVSLAHPSLLRVHDFGFLPDLTAAPSQRPVQLLFYTADFVDGEPLLDAARGRRWKQVSPAVLGCLEAMRALHCAGVRHGDIKPSNVLVGADGRAVLIDLGCAGPMTQGPQTKVSGTRGFLAPELLAGEASDHRADLYAFGMTLAKVVEVLGSPPPRAVSRLIGKLTAARMTDRPSDVDEALEALGGEPSQMPLAWDRLGRFAGRVQALGETRAWVRALGAGVAGPRAVQVRGPRGVGRTRFLHEVKWDAQQQMAVVEAHPLALGSLERALRRVLGDDDLTCVLGVVLEALARKDLAGGERLLLMIDDLDGFSEREREVVVGLARSLSRSSSLGMVWSECTGKAVEGDDVTAVELGPLTREELHAWLWPRLDEAALQSLHESTAGFPGRVIAKLGAARALGPERAGPTHRGLPALSSGARRALGALVAAEGTLADADVDAMGVTRDSLVALHACGLATRDGSLWKLAHAWDDEQVVRAVGAKSMQASRTKTATQLLAIAGQSETEPSRASRLRAQAVQQLVLAGESAGALREASRWAGAYGHSPARWADALGLLAEASGDARMSLYAARCEIEAGRFKAGIARLDELAKAPGEGETAWEAHLEAGLGYSRIADHASATIRFQRVLDGKATLELRGRACDGWARSCIRQGRYREAASWASRGLAFETKGGLRAELLCSAGIAHSYLGDADEAERNLEAAVGLLDDSSAVSERVRILGSKGVHAYRQGRLAEAARNHRLALDASRASELHSSIATAALNLGAVLHQQGEFAQGQEVYALGLRTATALAQHGTAAWLLYDLAKLQADLGQLDWAWQTAERCEALSRRIGDGVTQLAADAVLGEIACLRGDTATGKQRLSCARDGFATQESVWERVELQLQLAEANLLDKDCAAAGECLASARDHEGATEPASRDIAVRYAIVEARWRLACGQLPAVAPSLETALEEARAVGLRDAEAEIGLLLATAWQSQGAPSIASGYRDKAREVWERLAAPLTPSQREAFWAHPRRAPLAANATEPAAREEATIESRFQLLLEINKRINSSLSSEEVLRRAMDAAVELTGAERGFLLLKSEAGAGELRVAVARNVDHEQIAKSHMKFSRSIAERVVATREPVMTTDAQSDERFRGEESVHAMSLQSVLCVPVESPSGVLGALYLDNRFSRGRFRARDAGLLLAFADQVAIALSNARLHAELQRRNQELERERKRVQDMMDSQAVQLDRLQEEVRQTRRSLGRRHDFQQIVGTSGAMQRTLEVLDRVVDTPVPVLIEGESGTGKELFARALHDHGTRRERPFVAINCGAMPEALLESELFGHERGAFTGADRAREGLIVMCGGGTLFLDEIGEMPPSMQVKLLRVLQEREVRPVGGTRNVPVEFRLVSATNRRLEEEIERGAFRSDLFYRISAVQIRVPALRERIEDVAALSEHLLRKVCASMERDVPRLSRTAIARLAAHSWPGNVRQLENVLVKAVVMAEGDRIEAGDIELPEERAAALGGAGRRGFEKQEVERILEVLKAHRWNVTRALPELGIPRATLYRLLKRHGVLAR